MSFVPPSHRYFAPAPTAYNASHALYELTGAPAVPPRYAMAFMATYCTSVALPGQVAQRRGPADGNMGLLCVSAGFSRSSSPSFSQHGPLMPHHTRGLQVSPRPAACQAPRHASNAQRLVAPASTMQQVEGNMTQFREQDYPIDSFIMARAAANHASRSSPPSRAAVTNDHHPLSPVALPPPLGLRLVRTRPLRPIRRTGRLQLRRLWLQSKVE